MGSRLRMVATGALLMVLLGGCAGREVLPEIALETNDPVQQFNGLKQDLASARAEQFDVLAPESFVRANQLFEEAGRMLAREEKISDILLKVTSARVELQRAEQAVQISNTVLANVIKVRNNAIEAGAIALGEDFAEAEEEFLKLTRAIESSELTWAQRHKAKVFDAFDQLELRAIKDRHLNEPRSLLAALEQRRAAKQAPLTLAEARDQLHQAEMFISENRYQTDEIRRKSAAALFQARRLETVMQESERLKTLNPEQIAREMEHQLFSTSSRLGAPDQRDQLFAEQLESILATVEAWEAASQALNDEVIAREREVGKLREEIATLEGVTREEREARERLAEEKLAARKHLEEERRIQQLFTQLQDLFKPGEAEIYKQADRFIIRLKALTFPVGSSTVSTENYPLLGKVRRAIRLFDRPETIIEGHTDSTGSEFKNRELSQSRADAVKSYLEASETLPGGKITSIGYGSQRPLASNATADGRTLNRRIDLVIKPVLPVQQESL
ncbi:MAG: OmpA family protein [Syntrophotaleaceae bacterium]